MVSHYQKAYSAKGEGESLNKEDLFYYIYGLLHSPDNRSRFSSDLKKMLPRIPLTQETADYKKFTQAGRALAEWHLNYETSEPYALLPTTHDHAAFDRLGVPDQRELGALGGGGYCNLAEIAAEK